MALNATQRGEVSARIQSTLDCPGGITKPQLLAVVNAIDDWWEANDSAANQAIPQPQRGILTTKQKAALFMLLMNRRYEVT